MTSLLSYDTKLLSASLAEFDDPKGEFRGMSLWDSQASQAGPYRNGTSAIILAKNVSGASSSGLLLHDVAELHIPFTLQSTNQAVGAGAWADAVLNGEYVSLGVAGSFCAIKDCKLTFGGKQIYPFNPRHQVNAFRSLLSTRSSDVMRAFGRRYGWGNCDIESEYFASRWELAPNNNLTLNPIPTTADFSTVASSNTPLGGFTQVAHRLRNKYRNGPYHGNANMLSRCLSLHGQPLDYGSPAGSNALTATNRKKDLRDRYTDGGPCNTAGGGVATVVDSAGFVVSGYLQLRLADLFPIFNSIPYGMLPDFQIELQFNNILNVQPTGGAGGTAGLTMAVNASTSVDGFCPVKVSQHGCTALSGVTQGSTNVSSLVGNVKTVNMVFGVLGTRANSPFNIAGGVVSVGAGGEQTYCRLVMPRVSVLGDSLAVFSTPTEKTVKFWRVESRLANAIVNSQDYISLDLSAGSINPVELSLVLFKAPGNNSAGVAELAWDNSNHLAQCISGLEPFLSSPGAELGEVELKVDNKTLFDKQDFGYAQDFYAFRSTTKDARPDLTHLDNYVVGSSTSVWNTQQVRPHVYDLTCRPDAVSAQIPNILFKARNISPYAITYDVHIKYLKQITLSYDGLTSICKDEPADVYE